MGNLVSCKRKKREKILFKRQSGRSVYKRKRRENRNFTVKNNQEWDGSPIMQDPFTVPLSNRREKIRELKCIIEDSGI